MLDVNIDFAQSHWFFPKIIITCLICLLMIILVKERKIIAASVKSFSWQKIINNNNYKAYFFLALISGYILIMQQLGEIFPNTGYAFLIATVPFLFIIPFLMEKEITQRKVIYITINSILSPVIAWVVLGQMFGITLP
ncbi:MULTISPECIES: tripartite tricarboxylate transporter TctB family protein [Vibrio]|uniref:Tripartite tricarboxylate transporter TctB family protein n=1 Tax=Vibrio ostreae TaxID=2841925 RepID=A0A975U7S5_9VIBR|nr:MULTISPECIES: tripartite tricarboxylate transporter TctB family protein [Vibrio]QXO15942.1 tripartite tricarboxylate transporter TctB family protein [Vibrio ostreae]QXO15992.1 tripartite tricarboxylate transporter TctB family protein [Vibrio ostreae]